MTEPLDLARVRRDMAANQYPHEEDCLALIAELEQCRAQLAITEDERDDFRGLYEEYAAMAGEAEAAIARAEALHRRIPDRFPDRNPDVCEQCLEPYSGCHEPWPCPTMRALRGTND